MARGALFIISGPSGAGKGTIVNLLRDRDPSLWVSISATTRSPRSGEVEGTSYYFVSEDEFKNLINTNGLLEWACVHGRYYGTPRERVEEHIATGDRVILEIDPQGALQVKDIAPSATLIFIMPPSIDELRRRLEERSTENEDQIEVRCNNAVDEIALAEKYDYVVLNDDVFSAVDEVLEIIDKTNPKEK